MASPIASPDKDGDGFCNGGLDVLQVESAEALGATKK
jgi:hypothetical protein